MATALFDTEVYPNYFLCKFFNPATSGEGDFELYEGHPLDKEKLKEVLTKYELVSFNGINFDVPIVCLALAGASNEELKGACDLIIRDSLKSWQFEQRYDIKIPKLNHIDLIEVAPGVMDSLKIYGGRLHTKKMQDLPYPPNTILSPEQMAEVKKYCGNDVKGLTLDLYNALSVELDLRREMSAQYGVDLRSKSNPQIAETIICSEIEKLQDAPVKRSDAKPGMTFKYEVPKFISFQTEYLKNVLRLVQESTFTVTNSGAVEGLHEELAEPIEIKGSTYQIGIGGLHSCESCVSYRSDVYTQILEQDVTSYYPFIILVCSLFPKHIGKVFLDIYRSLVDTKLYATVKKVIECAKVQINGLFGKLGSKHSKLFSPDLMLQITITGQLATIMLIEDLELNSIPVISANTDGIVIACPRERLADMNKIVRTWEHDTGFKLKDTPYLAIHSRDVNNYIAVKTDGTIKRRGVFRKPDLQHNPKNEICTDALIAYLRDETPMEQTIKDCTDIRKFVEVRRVNGGALYGAIVTKTKESIGFNEEGVEKFTTHTEIEGGVYIGKAIRWYHSTAPVEELVDGKSGNHVADSDGGMPCMELPNSLPDDIDYGWYMRQAEAMLRGVGFSESFLQWKGYFNEDADSE
jgi:hypothetical protein